MFASVCFGGSRELPSCFGAFVGGVVGRVLAAAPRASFAVGCAAGGDALALQSLAVRGAAARVSVFCAGDASGAGFWRFSAFSVVQSVVAAGASPVWLAGGPLSAPLGERLAARSRAALVPGGVPVSVACWFLFSPVSRGSLAAARAAASAGIPVVVFCCGWDSSLLAPLLAGGSWAPVLGGPFVGGFVWVPAGALCLPSVGLGRRCGAWRAVAACVRGGLRCAWCASGGVLVRCARAAGLRRVSCLLSVGPRGGFVARPPFFAESP